MAPSCKGLETKLFGLSDFSCIHGYPHEFHYELWKKHAPTFYGNRKYSLLFVEYFMGFIEKFNFVHENVIIKMFTIFMKEMQKIGIVISIQFL